MSQLKHDLPDQFARHAVFLNDRYEVRRSGSCSADLPTGSDGARALQVLRRKWLSIASIVGIGTLLLTVVALLVPPRYTAMAQIEIVPASQALDASRPAGDARVTQMLVDAHLVRLRARDFLRAVLRSLTSAMPPATATAPAADWLQEELALEDFEQRLSVSQMLSSNVIAIRFTSRDPAEAAVVANGIVSEFSSQLQLARDRARQDEQSRIASQISELQVRMAARRMQLRALLFDTASERGDEVRALKDAARADAVAMSDLLEARSALSKRTDAPTSDVSVVSKASPPVRRSSPHPLLFIVPGVLLLSIGAMFVALSMDRLDHGIRSAAAASALTGAPCVGLVPRMPPFANPVAHVGRRPFAPYAESVRGIVASLDLVERRKPGAVVMLSCCVPGERKTEIAVAVSEYLAQLGKRVVLVDLDVRRPRVAALCGVMPGPGLAAVALEGVSAPSVVVTPNGAAFHALVMEDVPLDPMTLLGGDRLGKVFKDLRARYDVVIVDGPVAIGSAEAPLIARLADAVVLVVRWGGTRQLVAQNAACALRGSDGLPSAGAGQLSVVLSDVPLRRHAGYRFGDAIEVSMQRFGSMTKVHDAAASAKRTVERQVQQVQAVLMRVISRIKRTP